MAQNIISLLGYYIYASRLEEVDTNIQMPFIINTINPHSYITAKKDAKFKNALLGSNLLVPDGSGICLAARIIKGKYINKIAGSDVFDFYIKKMQQIEGRVFFMGSSQKVLDLIKNNLAHDYPKITAGYFSPPYKPDFNFEENELILTIINNFKPDILFVGMTAPKQEKWVYEQRFNLQAKVICSIGAVFDFYAGTVNRSGKVWIRLGLEWLPRLLREPKRLFRRNFISTPLFLFDVLLIKIGILKNL